MGTVLRLARTYPRQDRQGIGLHCRYYALYSRRKSLILTKAMEAPPLPCRADTVLREVAYSDIPAGAEKLGALRLLKVGVTKLHGELVFLRAAMKLIREQPEKPTIIHVHSANYVFAGLFLKMRHGIPLCLNFGGTEVMRARKLWPYRFAFRRLDAGFYVAREMEKSLFQYMEPEQCVYTANGYDPALFGDDGKERQKKIVAVGNLRWAKDYPVMIRAFARIADSFPDHRLEIIGDGDDRPMLEALIRDLALEGRVALVGYRTHREIRHALNTAQLYLMSSKTEGLPKSMIEAMACGLPVVCTDVGDCAAVKRDAGVAVPAGDPEALARAVRAVLSDPGRLEDLRRRALERSRDFSWEKVSSLVENTYDRLEGIATQCS